jgi:hypothetical protein
MRILRPTNSLRLNGGAGELKTPEKLLRNKNIIETFIGENAAARYFFTASSLAPSPPYNSL